MKRKKELKEGTIAKRKDGRFQGRYRESDNRYKYVYGYTYAECLNKLNDALAYRDRYLSDIKFYQWLDDWYSLYKKPNVKATTLYTIDVAIRVHIKKGLVNKPLKEISPIELQKFLIGIKKTRTRESVKNVLMESFTMATDIRLIDYNCMRGVRIPAHKRVKGSELSADEEQEFLDKVKGHKLESFFKFCLWTGCRRGETLSVHMSDVDFDKNILHIRGTKTEGSNRFIPLFPHVAELVKNLNVQSGPLFDFRPDYPTHVFKEFCPNHKLHDLRHTFATKCFKSRIADKVIQEWLGHSEISTTMDIYAHVTKEMHFDEAKKVKI